MEDWVAAGAGAEEEVGRAARASMDWRQDGRGWGWRTGRGRGKGKAFGEVRGWTERSGVGGRKAGEVKGMTMAIVGARESDIFRRGSVDDDEVR